VNRPLPDLDALDDAFMARAIEEARKGDPSPNPHVGAVIAHGDRLVAVGHHERAGDAHAEVDAIRTAGAAARGATLYCTLEPCNHFGRTPPCTDAIVEAGIARVVIGCQDPAPHVPGAVEKLRAAGVEVRVPVRRHACWLLVSDFARHITTGMPYAVLKAAVTLDGRLAARSGDSRWITGPEARAEAHRRRARADAVLVGVRTVLADDPALTVRHVEGRDPLRVVLDTHLATPPTAALAHGGTLIVHGPEADRERAAALDDRGVTRVEVPLAGGRLDLPAAMRALGERNVVRLLSEGGATVHGAMLDAGLYQYGTVFVAPKILGDPDAIPLAVGAAADTVEAAWRLSTPEVSVLGTDVLFEGELTRG
jgi:diaminohydroxyphosphoribosylaminopyrimidine deaminase/5-amino-6-(5-phosphoribosylamino)uracil reductase